MAETAVARPLGLRNRRQQRILELARPKESHSVWITDAGPRVMWGTQETLWPLSSQAMEANASPRLSELSQPKKNFQSGLKVNRPEYQYTCGRASVIWQVNPGAVQAEPTERITTLAQPKQSPTDYTDDRPHFVFSCGRSSPIWKVTHQAMRGPERPRTEHLARAKPVHANYQAERQVQTIIPRAALNGFASPRLETLAEAKNRPEGPFREPQWPVSENVRTFPGSDRLHELSRPKGYAQGYLKQREVTWPVKKSALKAIANDRLSELAQPIVRASMDHVQFDPAAFLVKQIALKAICTPRTNELSQPVIRP